jgi:UMF1 family MFS transporter
VTGDRSTTEWQPRTRSVVSWITYDLANTIFALGVAGLYFPTWLTENDVRDEALSWTVSSAMIVVILLSPWIGAVSDHAAKRSRLLIPTTVTAATATFFLASTSIAVSLVIYGIALVGFNLGGVVYDALLPDVSTQQTRGRVSGWGVGIGYVGSIIAVAAGSVLLDAYGYPAVFQAIALLFLVFATPAFLFIDERPRPKPAGPGPSFTRSLHQLVLTWKRAAAYDGIVRFLVGRFLYTDAINTLIGGFLAIFVVQELDFSDNEVQLLLGVAIVAAIVGGIVGGRLTDRYGPRRVLFGALYLWMVTMVGGILAAAIGQPALAWAIGPVGGLALGATWASDRVYMARISPPRYLGEFYGLYATVGRFATVLGPLIWGVIVNRLNLPRTVAMAALVGFVVAGRIVLGGVSDTVREWSPEDAGTVVGSAD